MICDSCRSEKDDLVCFCKDCLTQSSEAGTRTTKNVVFHEMFRMANRINDLEKALKLSQSEFNELSKTSMENMEMLFSKTKKG